LGIGAGGRVVKAANAVMVRLDDVAEANPGSIDNILSHDTFLTPAPGRPLMIPKGKLVIIGGAVDKGSFTEKNFEKQVEKNLNFLGSTIIKMIMIFKDNHFNKI
jgi:hypothetical protein